MEPGMDVALQRKDAIIRVRNAQISALWDELHTRQPWKNALAGELPIEFAEAGKKTNQTKRLAVMGINTVRSLLPSRQCRCSMYQAALVFLTLLTYLQEFRTKTAETCLPQFPCTLMILHPACLISFWWSLILMEQMLLVHAAMSSLGSAAYICFPVGPLPFVLAMAFGQ